MEPKKNTKKEELTKVELTNAIDYTKIFNKLFYSLIAITVVLLLILITILVKGTNLSTNDNSSTTGESEELGEYDVSMFDTLSTTDAIERIKSGDTTLVYIGRSTCGYCVQFLPVLQQAQEDYGYKTTYINLEEMSSEDQEKLIELDNEEKYIEENFGYTPMILVFKDGKYADGWVGYAEYDSFAEFLEDNGFSK